MLFYLTQFSLQSLSTRLAKDMVGKESGILPFPLQTTFVSSLRKAALKKKKLDMVLFWGGQIASVLKHRKAANLMQSLIEETSQILSNRDSK